MRTKVERISEGDDFADICKLALEQLFETQGTVKTPVLIFEKDRVIEVQCPLFDEEEDTEKWHASLLSSIVNLIRKIDPPELFIGYEGFYLMEEGAVRVLVGTLYSDDREQVWLAQTHGKTVGEWRDISDNPNRFGFEGLWKLAKSYLRN
jgi:hypothetical protein